ncbi:hypothetical protein [Asticcacaulis sp. AC402]|uniref:hypothetical protein n=1 Tax=Asticcacaulis sp. AC402 TaxID=1282361 RepID=UPI0003C3F743|nr:hypothetical protein [Asticcacaulis sp. AC402]ESQ73578.1 hypothetical protein ABAC402_18620 [Asticcacaulis sp. AC402]
MMRELPIVERTKYTGADRFRELIGAGLFLALPFIYRLFYPEQSAYFYEHLMAGDLSVFSPFNNLSDEPSQYRNRVFPTFSFFLPVFGVILLFRSLFKQDKTWTVTEDSVTCEILFLTGRRREIWSIREVAQVRLRRIFVGFGDDRYGLDLVLRSGKVLKLPAKRLRTTAERVKADIEAAAGLA